MLSPRAGYRAGDRPCPVSQELSWLLEQCETPQARFSGVNLLTFFTSTCFTVSRNQLGEATSPIGYHTPNPEEETPFLF